MGGVQPLKYRAIVWKVAACWPALGPSAFPQQTETTVNAKVVRISAALTAPGLLIWKHCHAVWRCFIKPASQTCLNAYRYVLSNWLNLGMPVLPVSVQCCCVKWALGWLVPHLNDNLRVSVWAEPPNLGRGIDTLCFRVYKSCSSGFSGWYWYFLYQCLYVYLLNLFYITIQTGAASILVGFPLW